MGQFNLVTGDLYLFNCSLNHLYYLSTCICLKLFLTKKGVKYFPSMLGFIYSYLNCSYDGKGMGLKLSVNLNLGLLEMTFIKRDGVGEYLKGLFLYGPS